MKLVVLVILGLAIQAAFCSIWSVGCGVVDERGLFDIKDLGTL